MTMITVRGRLAFASIWTPTAFGDSPVEKYRARIIIDPKDTASVKAIRDARKQVAEAKWAKKATGIMSAIAGDRQKDSWFESDYVSQDGEINDGFEGMFHLSTTSEVQPTIIDRDRTELSRRDGRPYAGCYCVFKVDIWPQDNKNGKAMRAQLAGIQFWKDGDAFGGGVRAKVDDFDDLSDLGEDDEPTTERAAPKAAGRKPAPPADDDDDIA